MSASFKSHAARAVIFVASFAAASAVMVAVGGAFHAAGSRAVLRDSPHARAVIARCDARPQRDERRDCVRRVIAAAQARDAGAAVLASAR
jgi:hypothetical protein